MFEILSHWLGGLTPGSQLSRRAWLEIYYTPKGESDVKDISEDVSKYFLSLSWSDNMSGRVDDVTLTLEDRGHLWSSSWFPTQGSTLSFVVHTYNWKNLSDGEKTLDLGNYEIDEIEITGMPSTVQIKAVSVAADNTLRGVKRNRTWEEISIKKCATDICDDNAVKLFWDCASDPNLDHIEQSDQSDLDFLQKNPELLPQYVHPIREVLAGWPQVRLGAEEAARVRNGIACACPAGLLDGIRANGGLALLLQGDTELAVASLQENPSGPVLAITRGLWN